MIEATPLLQHCSLLRVYEFSLFQNELFLFTNQIKTMVTFTAEIC